ncbi:MAG: sulfatase-like hydrolase/transferase [Phycisphaerae bacterium]|nr:sulfatase-like hydrolase/transferase [Phycisphaerae bacterium]
MERRKFLKYCGVTASTLILPSCVAKAQNSDNKKLPNIIYIMLDELGYFELSCMGNTKVSTPNIDRMASEGMRFTQMLAGGCVCAPTRSVLMTGKHLGHTTVRANGGGMALLEGEPTIASTLKQAGYATGGFGKWGLGDCGTTGVPEKHGFDLFYGYYHQVHAHSYYPRYLLRNSKKEYLKGNTGDYYEGETFAQDRIFEEATKFIRSNKDKPFFCYCPWTPPHGLWGFPKDDPAWKDYKDKDWTAGQQKPTDAKVYAAMIKMIDRQVGQILKTLDELGIDDNTLVFFCGDNGGQPYFNNGDPSKPKPKNPPYPHGFFGPNLNPATNERFRGGKGNFYEGGLRIPFIVRWPGKIKAKQVSNHLGYFPDVMATLSDITGTKAPNDIDGISFAPTLLDNSKKQKQHEYLYWEMGGQVAVRLGNYKMVRPGTNKDFELYDLAKDIEEKINIAKDKPEILAKMKNMASQAHVKNVVGTYLPGGKEKGFQGQSKD